MADLAVEAVDLRRVFRQRTGLGRPSSQVAAVDGVTFSVRRGSSLAVVGESGSGKTTVARILMGMDAPTSGSVLIDGEARPSRPGRGERRRWARKIQMVFQDAYSSMDPRQTIAGSIEETLRLHFGMDPASRRSRAGELLEQVNLDGRVAGSLPRHLSGGQRQRAAIARALAAEPDILVFDESVAALDVSIQAQVLNLINDIRLRRPISYVFITHDLAVARHVCDSVVVMRAGQIVEQGPSASVLTAPTSEYTRLLLDSIPGPGWSPRRRPAEARPTSVTIHDSSLL